MLAQKLQSLLTLVICEYVLQQLENIGKPRQLAF